MRQALETWSAADWQEREGKILVLSGDGFIVLDVIDSESDFVRSKYADKVVELFPVPKRGSVTLLID